MRIRFRVDGVLTEPMPPAPKNIQNGLISRMKVMADLNIAEKRVPQDGRISMKVGGKQLDLRVATLPTVYGEKVVLRILDKSNALLRLEDLGFLEDAYNRFAASFKQAVRRDPWSPGRPARASRRRCTGRSTSSTRSTRTSSRSRIPVEYRLAGVNQMQVNAEGGADLRGGPAVDPARRPRHRADR